MMGHTGKHLINPTTKYLGIQITGKLTPCEHCTKGKIRQAYIPKISINQQAKNPGERIFIDISSMIYPSAGGKKYWLLIVDEATDYTHSFFLKKKSNLVETMIIWIKNLFMKYHIRIKKIRLDNSRENRMLQAKTNQQNLGIKFKFTAPGTPQQNSVVERKFPTLMGRARAMMTHAGLDDYFKRKFWCEPVSTATKLDNMMVRHMGGKPPYYMFSRNVQNTENISEFLEK